LKNKFFLNEIFKIVKFLFNVFIIIDIAVFIRVLLMNYGEKLEYKNIKQTFLIIGTITIFLFFTKRWLKNINE